MQELLATLVREGKERGVQLAAYVDGELVVDAWAGIADPASQRPVTGDTLFPVFSATKGVAATLIHWLVERGQLTYDTPVAEVWPEFAAHGKAGITVRHVLNHTAGLPNIPMGIGLPELLDWETMCRAMAELSPVSAPGTQMCYHAVTFSWLVGEVARRVDGRRFAQMLDEEICRPLNLTGLFVGIPAEVEPRVAILEEVFAPGQTPARPDDSVPQSIPGWMWPLVTWMNRPDVRRACIPASNGIMTARALARHYAALLPGGVGGVELLPPERVRLATQLQVPSVNPADGAQQRRGLGYLLGGDPNLMGSRPAAFGHGGYGGALGFADPDYRLAVGFTKNFYSPNNSASQVLCELRESLGIPH